MSKVKVGEFELDIELPKGARIQTEKEAAEMMLLTSQIMGVFAANPELAYHSLAVAALCNVMALVLIDSTAVRDQVDLEKHSSQIYESMRLGLASGLKIRELERIQAAAAEPVFNGE